MVSLIIHKSRGLSKESPDITLGSLIFQRGNKNMRSFPSQHTTVPNSLLQCPSQHQEDPLSVLMSIIHIHTCQVTWQTQNLQRPKSGHRVNRNNDRWQATSKQRDKEQLQLKKMKSHGLLSFIDQQGQERRMREIPAVQPVILNIGNLLLQVR